MWSVPCGQGFWMQSRCSTIPSSRPCACSIINIIVMSYAYVLHSPLKRWRRQERNEDEHRTQDGQELIGEDKLVASQLWNKGHSCINCHRLEDVVIVQWYLPVATNVKKSTSSQMLLNTDAFKLIITVWTLDCYSEELAHERNRRATAKPE
jgi:hypothetical protein